MVANNMSRGGVPMVKIDGQKIRELREAKGLTQLYLATTVEVTTDTISRWENRRYPSVKKENALKLADILAVDLAEILDDGNLPPVREEDENSSAVLDTAIVKKRIPWLRVGLATIVAALALVLWWVWSGGTESPLAAERVMPQHSAPGQPFPVLLKITNSGGEPLAFILREQIPAQATVLQSHSSAAVSVDLKTGGLKCLGKIKQTEKTLGYILTTAPKAKDLKLEGFITSRSQGGRHLRVRGAQNIVLKPFHWADKNMDNKIDDQEILAVYDDYSEIKGLQIDMDLIEDIWFGSGYSWDAEKRQFVIIP